MEGALANGQCFARDLTDTLLDTPSMIRTQGKCLKDEQVERTLEVLSLAHAASLVWRQDITPPARSLSTPVDAG